MGVAGSEVLDSVVLGSECERLIVPSMQVEHFVSAHLSISY